MFPQKKHSSDPLTNIKSLDFGVGYRSLGPDDSKLYPFFRVMNEWPKTSWTIGDDYNALILVILANNGQ